MCVLYSFSPLHGKGVPTLPESWGFSSGNTSENNFKLQVLYLVDNR